MDVKKGTCIEHKIEIINITPLEFDILDVKYQKNNGESSYVDRHAAAIISDRRSID
jgi:hypothetical protein